MITDPFSQVYTALWDLAEGHGDLTQLVLLRNRIRYDSSDRDPEKKTYTEADTPELALMSTGVSGNLWNTSTTSMCIRRYSWMIITGDMRVNYTLMPVEWALFRAMHGWRTVLPALKWKGNSYVKRLNLLDIQEGILRPNERQDGPRGWSCVWGIEVEMHFAIGDL